MVTRRKAVARSVFALIVVLVTVFAALMVKSRIRHADVRDVLLEQLSQIQLLDAHDRAAQIIQSPSLTVKFLDSRTLAIATPGEIGATNWIGIIQCDVDGKIIGIGVRTADSFRIKPEGALGDRVLPESRQQWCERFCLKNR